MARVASEAITATTQLVANPTGLSFQLAQIVGPLGNAEQAQVQLAVRRTQTSMDVMEKAGLPYPLVSVSCERIKNELREKGRTFSGTLEMAIEVKLSSYSLDDLQQNVVSYAEALMALLDGSRGSWSTGLYFGGRYEATVGAAKTGGKQFVQSAKVTFELDASV